jgi:hypothetical protein
VKRDLRLLVSLLAIAVSILSFSGLARAQTVNETQDRTPRLPQQIIPTGAEDAPSTARAASVSRQAEQLEQQLRAMTSESSEGLVPVTQANGTVTVDLEGRFMSVLVATPSEDGGAAVSCHTGHEALEAAEHAQHVAEGKAPKTAAVERPQPAIAEEK